MNDVHATTPAALSAFLQDPRSGPPALSVLRRYHMGAYAYNQLSAAEPLRAVLREDYRRAALRHQVVKAELRPLLHAWQQAGIPVMVLKGFYLAEFVYASPMLRYYGDVDVLLRPEYIACASQIAQTLGWRETWNADDSLTPHKHEVVHLVSISGQVSLDVHRRVVHNAFRASILQQRITDEVWRRRQPLPWCGLLAPHPVDALLVCLILNRLWVSEGWFLKAQDLLDFKALVQAHNITPAELSARARELGCPRTLRQFLRRCDGFRNRVDLRAPTPSQRWLWDLELIPERGSLMAESVLVAASQLPLLTLDVLRELPRVLRATGALRPGMSVTRALDSMLPPPVAPRPFSRREVQRTVRGVHWGLTLLRVRPGANCLPRALALFASLRGRGYPAVFCSGVRRQGDAIQGHAWVELYGAPLEDPYVRENVRSYRVTLRFPPQLEV